MIIPFIFTLDEFGKQFPTYLWTFYKFMDFGEKNNCPIIAQEKFFGDLNNEFNMHAARLDVNLDVFEYKLPTEKQLEKNFEYRITKDEEYSVIKDYKSVEDAWVNILKSRNHNLEEIIESKIKKIEQGYKEKVDAIFTWIWLPSLEQVCKINNIKLIFYEFSTIRKPRYNMTLGYFQFCDKYNSYYTKRDLEEFKKEKKIILSRKELLTLFLNKDSLNNIKYLYSIPEYKIGYALGLSDDKFEKTFSKMKMEEIISKIKQAYDYDEVLIRPHPQTEIKNKTFPFELDKSKETSEWIAKCETIISNISNVAYEACLYNRRIINLYDGMPTSFSECSDLSYFDEKIYGLSELNYLTFYCYTPYELMFNKEYIKWRLTNPSITEIYEYNLKYIFNKYNIDMCEFNEIKIKDRVAYLAKKVHNIDSTEIYELSKYFQLNIKKDYDSIINRERKLNKDLKDDNEGLMKSNQKLNEKIKKNDEDYMKLKLYLDCIEQSNSWKITKPLRTIKEKIKNINKRNN